MLCTAIASDLPRPPNLLLWQPAQQGKAQLQQFLRLMAAAQLADGGGKAILDAARAALAAGRPVNVAGYTLSASLAQGLEAALLQPPAVPAETAGGDADAPRLVWLETGSAATLSPASQAALPRWRAAGWVADAQAVVGPPFWQTTEIEDAPALVAATVAALDHPLAAARPTVPETTP